MKTSQKAINTYSTIAETKTEIQSSCSITPSGVQVFQRRNDKKSPQRTVSIMEEARNKKLFNRQSTDINLQRAKTVKINHVVEVSTNQRTVDLQIVNALAKIFFKKKRYCFQVLKQFYLFPDETQSSIQSLSVYDPLVFQEEIIHSLVKIMETRLITNKIWGFINLKMMPFLKAAKKIGQKVTHIQQRTKKHHKKYSFEMIKEAAEEAISVIKKPETIKQSRFLQINTSYLYNENKQVQCEVEQKARTRKSCLSSNLVYQQVRPTTKVQAKTEVKPVFESTTRVYTREEYELKYGKMKQRNENYEPKIVRISSPDYSQRKNTFSQVLTNVQTTYKTTELPQLPVPTTKIVYSEPRPQIQVPKTKQHNTLTTELKSPRTYNIIHYHERPREINHHTSLTDIKKHTCAVKNSCLSRLSCSPCVHTCSCYQNCYCKCSYVAQSRVSCCSNNKQCCSSTFCEKYQKNDMVNETRVSEHVKFINEPKSAKNIHSKLGQQYELSELESRIQYLNFLKSLIKDQEMQQSIAR